MTSSSFPPATTAARSRSTVTRCHPERPSTYASGLAAGMDFFMAANGTERFLSAERLFHRHRWSGLTRHAVRLADHRSPYLVRQWMRLLTRPTRFRALPGVRA